MNSYVSTKYFITHEKKLHPRSPALNHFWLSPPLKRAEPLSFVRAEREKQSCEQSWCRPLLVGACAPNRLHRQTHAAASASSRRYGDLPCGERGGGKGVETALAFLNIRKWSVSIEHLYLNWLHGSAAEEMHLLMSRWRGMKGWGLWKGWNEGKRQAQVSESLLKCH